MGPLVTREEGKKKEKEKLTVGRIKLYTYGIEVCQVGCEPVVFSQRGNGRNQVSGHRYARHCNRE